MTNEGDQQQDTPEELTMKDLWRALNGWRTELKEVILGVEARINKKFEVVDTRFDEAQAERALLREESDVIRKELLELASHKDFRELKGEIAEVRNDGRLTRQEVREVKSEVSRLRADVKKAGIPVR